jgi:hypothetical protein
MNKYSMTDLKERGGQVCAAFSRVIWHSTCLERGFIVERYGVSGLVEHSNLQNILSTVIIYWIEVTLAAGCRLLIVRLVSGDWDRLGELTRGKSPVIKTSGVGSDVAGI